MITKDEIRHIAKLARLEIPEGSLDKMATDMNNIINMVDKLAGLGCSDADVLSSLPRAEADSVRQDEAGTSLPRQAVLSNAPESYAGCFVVPKTVE